MARDCPLPASHACRGRHAGLLLQAVVEYHGILNTAPVLALVAIAA